MLNARTNQDELVNAGTDNSRLARGTSVKHDTRTNVRNRRASRNLLLAVVMLFAPARGVPGLVSAALAQDLPEFGALNGKSPKKAKLSRRGKRKKETQQPQPATS